MPYLDFYPSSRIDEIALILLAILVGEIPGLAGAYGLRIAKCEAEDVLNGCLSVSFGAKRDYLCVQISKLSGTGAQQWHDLLQTTGNWTQNSLDD